jgi:hypothetical protein
MVVPIDSPHLILVQRIAPSPSPSLLLFEAEPPRPNHLEQLVVVLRPGSAPSLLSVAHVLHLSPDCAIGTYLSDIPRPCHSRKYYKQTYLFSFSFSFSQQTNQLNTFLPPSQPERLTRRPILPSTLEDRPSIGRIASDTTLPRASHNATPTTRRLPRTNVSVSGTRVGATNGAHPWS